jgi:hypothetical protein
MRLSGDLGAIPSTPSTDGNAVVVPDPKTGEFPDRSWGGTTGRQTVVART